jgi:SAM-dependent methyltransferase
VPFKLDELRQAGMAYRQFLDQKPPAHHARYIFPFFAGSYFSYRKVDVLRVASVAKAASSNSSSGGEPSYLDVGCGYGDFLAKIREYIPSAAGIEKEGGIFYALQHRAGEAKPDYVEVGAVELLSKPVDVAFVGWMEPGQDFRRHVARIARCVVTTFDAGGQCGINGGCEYDEFGYEQVARWRTPSWIDVNAELMNRYYTPALSGPEKLRLAKLRSAHNLWYVYARPEIAGRVRAGLEAHLAREDPADRYDFEQVLDEVGFGYMEELPTLVSARRLWEVEFG